MGKIRFITEEDYIKYRVIFEKVPSLMEAVLFIFTYDNNERLISKTDEKIEVYQLLPNGEYNKTELYYNEDSRLERLDYYEYSLLMNRVPKFINNDTKCSDIIYGSEDGKYLNYSQISTVNGSRLLLQYVADEKRSNTFRQMTTVRPELICFQNDVKESEEQRFTGGGLVFAKTANPDVYVRIYGIKSNGEHVKYPIFSKTYEYKVLKEMIEKGGFNEYLPEHFADLYATNEISLCFELGMDIDNFGKNHNSIRVYGKNKSNI